MLFQPTIFNSHCSNSCSHSGYPPINREGSPAPEVLELQTDHLHVDPLEHFGIEHKLEERAALVRQQQELLQYQQYLLTHGRQPSSEYIPTPHSSYAEIPLEKRSSHEVRPSAAYYPVKTSSFKHIAEKHEEKKEEKVVEKGEKDQKELVTKASKQKDEAIDWAMKQEVGVNVSLGLSGLAERVAEAGEHFSKDAVPKIEETEHILEEKCCESGLCEIHKEKKAEIVEVSMGEQLKETGSNIIEGTKEKLGQTTDFYEQRY